MTSTATAATARDVDQAMKLGKRYATAAGHHYRVQSVARIIRTVGPIGAPVLFAAFPLTFFGWIDRHDNSDRLRRVAGDVQPAWLAGSMRDTPGVRPDPTRQEP